MVAVPEPAQASSSVTCTGCRPMSKACRQSPQSTAPGRVEQRADVVSGIARLNLRFAHQRVEVLGQRGDLAAVAIDQVELPDIDRRQQPAEDRHRCREHFLGVIEIEPQRGIEPLAALRHELDLFGADKSTNAAAYFATGIKGRPDEDKFEDHVEADTEYAIEEPDADGKGIHQLKVPTRNAMNLIARRGYSKDCEIGLVRWNRAIKKAGIDFELTLPSERFRRSVGPFADFSMNPQGQPISRDEYDKNIYDWIPSPSDKAFVKSLMRQVVEPGKMAGWLAPPDRGINNQPVDYEYVRL